MFKGENRDGTQSQTPSIGRMVTETKGALPVKRGLEGRRTSFYCASQMMCFLFVSFFYKLKARSSTSEMIKTCFIKTVALLL